MIILLIAGSASAAPACRNLPGSSLRLYSSQSTATEEHPATRSDIDWIAREIGMSAAARTAHPLMLIIAQLGAQIAVVPRIIETRDGGELAYCNAPSSVEVGLGVVGRKVFLTEEAAADPCVRSVLLDHQAEHSRALDDEIEVFIRQRREGLAARLRELKQTPAPDRASAITAFKSGLGSFLADMVKQFESEIERSREGVDTPERLKGLRNACGGKVRQLELELITPARGGLARDNDRRAIFPLTNPNPRQGRVDRDPNDHTRFSPAISALRATRKPRAQ